MESSRRKTRSDKFPLTLHPTGQYCKKIRSSFYYFGKDKQQALQRYLEESSEHRCHQQGEDYSEEEGHLHFGAGSQVA